MAHLGILVSFIHFPRIEPSPRHIAPGLRAMLERQIGAIDRVSVFCCHDGDIPIDPAICDAWMVSGPAMVWDAHHRGNEERLERFLRAAAATGKRLFGLWHGEASLLRALGETPSEEVQFPMSVRNPVWQFRASDTLHIWDGKTGSISTAAPVRIREASVFRFLTRARGAV